MQGSFLPTYILNGPEEAINVDTETSSNSMKLTPANNPKNTTLQDVRCV
jgi:DNA polymerase III sliding clamp (beta) subunit (PCNA family)